MSSAKCGYCVSPARLPGCWQDKRSTAWQRHCVGTQKSCFELQSLPVAVPMAAAAAMPGGGGGEPRGGGRQPGVESHCSPLPESPNLSVPPFPPLCNGDDRDSACSKVTMSRASVRGRWLVHAGRNRGVRGQPMPCRKRNLKGSSSQSSNMSRRRGRAARDSG